LSYLFTVFLDVGPEGRVHGRKPLDDVLADGVVICLLVRLKAVAEKRGGVRTIFFFGEEENRRTLARAQQLQQQQQQQSYRCPFSQQRHSGSSGQMKPWGLPMESTRQK
jgi:hypothetical protein